MITSFVVNGYLPLFFWSFLAATLVPVGSEWFLAALVIKDYDPMLLLCVASAGNVLGALTPYTLGFFGSERLTRRILRMKPETIDKAHGIFMRYGIWSLLFSWLPLIGDALCLAGGALKIPVTVFFPLVLAGKILRYWAVIHLMSPGFLF